MNLQKIRDFLSRKNNDGYALKILGEKAKLIRFAEFAKNENILDYLEIIDFIMTKEGKKADIEDVRRFFASCILEAREKPKEEEEKKPLYKRIF